MAPEPVPAAPQPRVSVLRAFLADEAGGLVLMGAAALALVLTNSPPATASFGALDASLGPLSAPPWINDALTAAFVLLVGLEIKREVLDGQLSTWPRRVLPGVAALDGLAVPALVFVTLNRDSPEFLRGWAIPTAADIAFALGVLALLEPRVPVSLKVFLAALAIIDDRLYAADPTVPCLGLAGLALGPLVVLNRAVVERLAPFPLLGALLWVCWSPGSTPSWRALPWPSRSRSRSRRRADPTTPPRRCTP